MSWHREWVERARRLAASSRAPAVAAAALAPVGVVEALARTPGAGVTAQFTVVACLAALATTLPLGLARPAAAAVAVSSASLVSLVLLHTTTAAGLAAQLLALYRLGLTGSPRGSRGGELLAAVGLSVPFLLVALAALPPAGSEEGIAALLLACLAPAAALVGTARRARREARAHAAAQQAMSDTLLDHATRGERARIARELHDVVAHHISMVAVQAETARLATPGMPAAGAQRLAAIGDTARAALTEMRLLLGVLRDDAGADAGDRRPQPGLYQLNELIDGARSTSGAGIRLIVHGAVVPLDPGVELAAYRIVQEALTNARRHAPGAATDVELHYAGGTLGLRIRDNGPGLPATDLVSGGHGLDGMRERAAAVGGELHTGAGPGGGFLVDATLPMAPGTGT